MTRWLECLFLATGLIVAAQADASSAVEGWLKKHRTYRLATRADCQCEDSLKATPGMEPYRAIGDFDGDGMQDEAVVVVNLSNAKDYRLLVFASKFSRGQSPLVYEEWFDAPLVGIALFKFKPAKGKGDALGMGRFFSESDVINLPVELPERLD